MESDLHVQKNSVHDYYDSEALTSPDQAILAGKDVEFADFVSNTNVAFLGPNLWTGSKQEQIKLDFFESNPGKEIEMPNVILDQSVEGDTSTVHLPAILAGKDDEFADFISNTNMAFLGPNLWTGSKQEQIKLDFFESNPGKELEMPNVILDQSEEGDTSTVHLPAILAGKDDEFADFISNTNMAFLGPNLWTGSKQEQIKLDFFESNPGKELEMPNVILDQSEEGDTSTVYLPAILAGIDDEFADFISNDNMAFLGPNLWTDSKQEQIKLDFFETNPGKELEMPNVILDQSIEGEACDTSNVHLPVLQSTSQSLSQVSSPLDTGFSKEFIDALDGCSRSFSVECNFSPSDLALATPPGHKHYDPASTIISEDKLKPQPVRKKSRRNLVRDNLKDDKYLARRHKNNMAAKCFRKAQRPKNNQIFLRFQQLGKSSSLNEDVLHMLQSTSQSLSQVSSPLDTGFSKDFTDGLDGSSRSFAVECNFSPSDLALATPPGQKYYDPASTIISEDKLKPKPVRKKSRRNLVPDNLKDYKYWDKRRKNSISAKRSRDARRVKENQILLRASYLEKENSSLRKDVIRLENENRLLKKQLQKYQF